MLGGMKSVGIVGGGITGLVAAWHLATHEPGLEITLLEASRRIGGKLRQEEIGGHRVDVGAESALWRRPEVADLLAELGVESTHPQRFPAMLWSRGALEFLPAGTLMGIPSDPAAARGLLDPAEIARAADAAPVTLAAGGDITVGEAVEQSLGAAVVDRMVEPLLGGVYAGHARELSAQACVPALHAALLAGTPLMRAAAASSAVSSNDTREVFGAPMGGMGSLPVVLHEALGARNVAVVTGADVVEMRRSLGHRGTWHVEVDLDGLREPREFDALVLTTPAPVTARLLAQAAPDAARELGGIDYASMAIVTFAFPAEVGRHLPEGTGFLVPPVDGRSIKAATFSSVKWPWLARSAPATTYVRVSLGRHREAAVLDLDDDAIVAAGLADLEAALGRVLPAPVDTHVQRWRDALPQYALGHRDRIARTEAALASVPGLHLAGAALRGVGIPACVASARGAADALLRELGASAPSAPRSGSTEGEGR